MEPPIWAAPLLTLAISLESLAAVRGRLYPKVIQAAFRCCCRSAPELNADHSQLSKVPFEQVGQPESRLAYSFGNPVLPLKPLFNLPVALWK